MFEPRGDKAAGRHPWMRDKVLRSKEGADLSFLDKVLRSKEGADLSFLDKVLRSKEGADLSFLDKASRPKYLGARRKPRIVLNRDGFRTGARVENNYP